MPSTDNSITDITNKIMGYWYACGYNDHRQQETGRPQPYVDPEAFSERWAVLANQPSRPSLQDAFKTFAHKVLAS
jgi:hypothetical protein